MRKYRKNINDKKARKQRLRKGRKRNANRSRKVYRKILNKDNHNLKRKKTKIRIDRSKTMTQNIKKRMVIFLGAGATICFGGPSGKQILHRLKTDRKYRTKDDIPIGQFLYDKLYETFGDQTNFETIVASIELILNYNISQVNPNYDPIYKSIVPVFLSLDKSVLNHIDNFTLHEIPEENETVILEYHVNDHTDTITWPRSTAKIYYYSKILTHFLSIISIEISKYSGGEISYNQKLNSLVNFLISSNYQINFFTTNYDNLIPDLLNEKNIFNGFDLPIKDLDAHLFNTEKIVFDDSNIKHFNLHGSIYWHHEFLMEFSDYRFIFDKKGYFLPVITKTDFVNPGEELVVSNIITGYNKTQRTLYPPFSLILDSFIKECFRADVLLIVGYSFSDNHINKILSLPFNDKQIKIIYITKSENNSIDAKEDERLKNILKKHYKISNEQIGESTFCSNDKYQIVYLNGFDGFLDNYELWRKVF